MQQSPVPESSSSSVPSVDEPAGVNAISFIGLALALMSVGVSGKLGWDIWSGLKVGHSVITVTVQTPYYVLPLLAIFLSLIGASRPPRFLCYLAILLSALAFGGLVVAARGSPWTPKNLTSAVDGAIQNPPQHR